MAINAPTVQTLDQIMASLQPGYAAQQDVLNKQIAGVDVTANSQMSALDAAKTQGFNQINRQALGKGMAWSGIPQDEMADYLSNTYLPGIQKAQQEAAANKLTLEGQKAALGTDQRNKAMGVLENQQSALNQWNLQQAQIAATARENAANRAAAAAAQPKGLSGRELSKWAENYVKSNGADGRKRQGSDGKISPSEYYNGFSDFYTQTGLGQDEYMAVMAKYVNTSHGQDYKLY